MRTLFSNWVAAMPGKSTAAITPDSTRDAASGWEERSVQRVVEAGREHILDRSRRIVRAAYELIDEGLQANKKRTDMLML